jgi:hypothetical protein
MSFAPVTRRGRFLKARFAVKESEGFEIVRRDHVDIVATDMALAPDAIQQRRPVPGTGRAGKKRFVYPVLAR